MTFLLVANQINLNLKISWAEKLIKSYQNSTVIVTLISTKELNSKAVLGPSIQIIHYPANRNIDTHLLMLQTAKFLNNTCLCYVHHEPPANFNFKVNKDHNGYGLLEHNAQAVGFYLDSNKLLRSLKTDISTINSIRQAMMASGLHS